MKRIVVIGSSNTDMVVKAPHLPAAGETVLGGEFMMNAGGKGANQAIACARLGGEVSMCGRIGKDPYGTELKNNLGKYLMLAATEDIFVTKNGKVVAKISNPYQDRVNIAKSLFGILPADVTLEEAREERLDRI